CDHRAVHHADRRRDPRRSGLVLPGPWGAAAGPDMGRHAERHRPHLHVCRPMAGPGAGSLPRGRSLQHQYLRRRAERPAGPKNAEPAMSWPRTLLAILAAAAMLTGCGPPRLSHLPEPTPADQPTYGGEL